MYSFALGFMVCAYLFLVLGGVYSFWRYSLVPWKVMRKDIAALVELDKKTNSRIDILEHSLSPTKIAMMSDEQLASIENRQRQARRNA